MGLVLSALLYFQDSDDGRKVQSEVKEYEQLLKTKLGNDKFVTVGVQTRDNGAVLRKLKDAQTNNAQHKESFTQWETLVEEDTAAEPQTGDMQRYATSATMGDAVSKVLTPLTYCGWQATASPRAFNEGTPSQHMFR